MKNEWVDIDYFYVEKLFYRKIESIEINKINSTRGESFFLDTCRPATEISYFEFLKSEAREKLGEIKFGATISFPLMGFEFFKVQNFLDNPGKFTFNRINDTLYFSSIPIYHKGNWAMKDQVVQLEKYINKEEAKFYEKYSIFEIASFFSENPDFDDFFSSQLQKFLNNNKK